MSERNKDSEIFKQLSMHVSLRGCSSSICASVGINTTDYSTEVGGRVVNEFTDEHELSRLYSVLVY